jgi:hypothetical protein
MARGNALQGALAIDVADREAELLRVVHDPAFRVGGRTCEVVRVCASIRDLEQVIGSGAADAAVVASQLNAIPRQTLEALAQRRTRLIVLATDPTDPVCSDFPGGLVLGLEPTPEM